MLTGTGRELHGVDHSHGRRVRDEHYDVIIINRPVRRASALLATWFIAAVVTLMLVDVAASHAEPMPVGVPGNWALRLNEEFTSAGLNTALWTPGWQHSGISGPVSEQCLSSSNVEQPGNGYLYLWTKKAANTCEGTKVQYTGGLIESNPGDGVSGHTGFQYSYGYVEWRAFVTGTEEYCSSKCLPDWPALWSLPSNHKTEIDTMEGLLGEACYHFHPPFPGGTGGCASGNFYGWHTYGVDWEPGVVTFYYDGSQVGRVSSSEVEGAPQYLVMDMVPPGKYGGTLVAPGGLVLDYVRVWQPPPPTPPSATTGVATNVQQFQATLNGEVNPEGSDTHYYFQYGPTASYGFDVPASPGNDAGSGTTSVGASATASGLHANTTYHYRLVASNANGTSYGADHEVKTEMTVTPAPLLHPSGAIKVFYRDGNGRLDWWEWNGTSWALNWLGENGALAGEPEPMLQSSGVIKVFYRDGTGRLDFWEWNGTSWALNWLGENGALAGSPMPMLQSNGVIKVFYRDGNGRLDFWEWNGTSWALNWLGENGALAGEPEPMFQSSGVIKVFYRDGNGRLDFWEWNGTAWTLNWLGESEAIAGEPVPLLLAHEPIKVFYGNPSGRLDFWEWNGTAWSSNWLGSDEAL
jgi:hypothetical protein